MYRFKTRQHDLNTQARLIWFSGWVRGMMIGVLGVSLMLNALSESADMPSGGSNSYPPPAPAPSKPSGSSSSSASGGKHANGGPQVKPKAPISKVQPIKARETIQPRQ